jgi:hypothetical protein
MDENFNVKVYDVIEYNNKKYYIDDKLKNIYNENVCLILQYENYSVIGKSNEENLKYFLDNNIIK